MRIGIVGILQESNTFIQNKTTLKDFQNDILAEGVEVREKFYDSHHEIGGFFHSLGQQGIEAVPLFVARALPYGIIDAVSWDFIMKRLDYALQEAGKLDGILAAPHGATVAENAPDADGFWLQKVRKAIGAKPIIATADPHGNLSQLQVSSVDAFLSYRTNPHMDQRQRGIEAGDLMGAVLKQKVVPTQAAEFLPFAVNIFSQNTSEEPLLSFLNKVQKVRETPGIIAVSIFLGFPYSDVPHMGAGLTVVADNDFELAKANASSLAKQWLDMKNAFNPVLPSVIESVSQMKSLPSPVCALDMGDNVGGGSPGDSTILAQELIEQNVFPFFTVIADPDTVAEAIKLGLGNSRTFIVGAKSDHFHGVPLHLTAKVVFLGEGKFSESNPTHGGINRFDQGKTAIITTPEGNTFIISSRRMVPFSLNQLLAFGIDPANYKVIIVKGVHAPLAAYKAVCKSFVRVDTEGVTSATLQRLPYKNRRKPMFPFEDFSH